MAVMRRLTVGLKDHPGSATTMVLLFVVAHALVAGSWARADTPALFENATDLVGVYAGFAGVAALVAGFIGVVVVFSTVTGTAWARIRELGGQSLIRNWTSPLRVTLSAALLAVAAALLVQIEYAAAAWWAFEASVLLVVSAAVRLVWLLNGLLQAQQKIDSVSLRKVPSLEDLGLPPAENRSAG